MDKGKKGELYGNLSADLEKKNNCSILYDSPFVKLLYFVNSDNFGILYHEIATKKKSCYKYVIIDITKIITVVLQTKKNTVDSLTTILVLMS